MEVIMWILATIIGIYIGRKYVIPFLDNLEKKVREKYESKEN